MRHKQFTYRYISRYFEFETPSLQLSYKDLYAYLVCSPELIVVEYFFGILKVHAFVRQKKREDERCDRFSFQV